MSEKIKKWMLLVTTNISSQLLVNKGLRLEFDVLDVS